MNAETMTDKPAPCPFCGGEALIGQTLDGAWYAWCAKDFCARLEAYWRTEAEALTAWNARTVQAELVEALRDARTTISITRTNAMSEIGRCADPSESRWAGVPEQLAKRIAAIDAAITQAEGPQQ